MLRGLAGLPSPELFDSFALPIMRVNQKTEKIPFIHNQFFRRIFVFRFDQTTWPKRMEKRFWISPVFLFIVILLTECDSQTSYYSDIPNDSVTIAKGQLAFSQNCSACHNFRQDGIGPQLGGITRTVPSEWIKDFIKNPKGLVDA